MVCVTLAGGCLGKGTGGMAACEPGAATVRKSWAALTWGTRWAMFGSFAGLEGFLVGCSWPREWGRQGWGKHPLYKCRECVKRHPLFWGRGCDLWHSLCWNGGKMDCWFGTHCEFKFNSLITLLAN
jgi:hypothetical protein